MRDWIMALFRWMIVPPAVPRVWPHRLEDLDRLRDHNDPTTKYGRTL